MRAMCVASMEKWLHFLFAHLRLGLPRLTPIIEPRKNNVLKQSTMFGNTTARKFI